MPWRSCSWTKSSSGAACSRRLASNRNRTTMTAQAKDLAGKVALITGATGGVGLRVAEGLAARGATVVINSRSAANCEQVAERLRANSRAVRVAVGDCADYATAAEVARQAAAETG